MKEPMALVSISTMCICVCVTLNLMLKTNLMIRNYETETSRCTEVLTLKIVKIEFKRNIQILVLRYLHNHTKCRKERHFKVVLLFFCLTKRKIQTFYCETKEVDAYPRPTSRHIIITKPKIVPHVAIKSLPLEF
jgi:hypothetical protein